MSNDIKLEIVSYNIPLYGNKHSSPYGIIKINGQPRRFEIHKKDRFRIKGKGLYRLVNKGTGWSPKLELVKEKKYVL